MVDLFFGAIRPATVVSARIEMKIPVGPDNKKMGRPVKVWAGASDADEAQVYVALCESKILSKVLNERKLVQDGSTVLTGILYFVEGSQIVLRHEFDFTYFAVDLEQKTGELSAFAQRCLEIYAEQVAGIRGDHKEFMKSSAEALGKLAEAYSSGLGKLSKHNRGISRMARRLERDRAKLTAALLAVNSQHRKDAQSSTGPSKLMTGLEAIKVLASLKDKTGNSDSSV